jgi:flagellar biosynthesis GTPase FlhF
MVLSELERKEYMKKNYQKNREERLAKQKKYYENNKERKRLQDKQYYQKNREELLAKQKKYQEEHKEEKKIYDRKYKQDNKERDREKYSEYRRQYEQTPVGKKIRMLSKWKNRGLDETDEELDIIYELYIQQEFCYSCDVKLTRDGVCPTQACLDHDHTTNKFRQICCRSCNTMDGWMKYWC